MAQTNTYAQKLLAAAELFKYNEWRYVASVRNMLAEQEWEMNLREAREQGRIIGRAQVRGRVRGIKTCQKAIVIRMKKLGDDIQHIADVTHLDVERINELGADCAAGADGTLKMPEAGTSPQTADSPLGASSRIATKSEDHDSDGLLDPQSMKTELEKAMAQGEAEGWLEYQELIAARMKKLGDDLRHIADVTCLSMEWIAELDTDLAEDSEGTKTTATANSVPHPADIAVQKESDALSPKSAEDSLTPPAANAAPPQSQSRVKYTFLTAETAHNLDLVEDMLANREKVITLVEPEERGLALGRVIGGAIGWDEGWAA